MDADILRLILLILGAFLILGIYLWERHKRINGRVQAIRRAEQEDRIEPVLGGHGDPETGRLATEPTIADEEMERALRELGDLVGDDDGFTARKKAPDTPRARRKSKTPDPVETRQQDLFADDAVVDDDHFKPKNDGDLPTLILQINIVSPARAFRGEELMRAIESVELQFGEMNIFHRRGGNNQKGAVLFSMASLVEPGTFPIDDMAGFTTPGLALFAQLPGAQDGLAIFSDMLMTAERLAADLGGELQDETHSRLTKQTVEHIRSQVLEHRRKVQLAKSRIQ